ncbi:hypothetical protein Q5H91_04045 [Sphingomonas sp. KR1UV-12]|uniref:Uncharacterized protein n=1 Tax=Sphingomonas aurea TaxID=3063994 RepID=A0ABT9EHE0_9SPHN|nr:hypothetical protein [Sphingomonas sp. KR1UV-12]MDP1026373.1 hypothetical protein [Sphingomonas sp. KR1UV-12]
MSVIAPDAVKGRMLKIKFGELLALAGGVEAAAGFCRVGKSALARYASLTAADVDFFAPIDVVHDLERLTGRPLVTCQLATLADGAFVALPTVPAGAGDLLGAVGQLSVEFSDATNAVCEGLKDGKFCTVDAARLEKEADDVIRVAVGLRALARAIKGEGR